MLALSVALAATACSSSASKQGARSPSPSTPAATASPARPALAHVVIIVDENKPATSVLGNSAAPYLTGLADTFASASDYSAITHPSLPNYLALTSGTTSGITSDCNPAGRACLPAVKNIADEIIAAGRTWKMYAESMPAPCAASNSGLYAVRHVPFLYYPDVRRSATYCDAHVVPYSQFAADLKGSTLPTYSMISPNLCDDMHNCSVRVGDDWMRANVPRILSSRAFTTQRSLLVITFDEGNSASNVVPCIFAGSAAKRGYVSSADFSHYSLLRTIEVELGLQPLAANDRTAQPMTDMLK